MQYNLPIQTIPRSTNLFIWQIRLQKAQDEWKKETYFAHASHITSLLTIPITQEMAASVCV